MAIDDLAPLDEFSMHNIVKDDDERAWSPFFGHDMMSSSTVTTVASPVHPSLVTGNDTMKDGLPTAQCSVFSSVLYDTPSMVVVLWIVLRRSSS